MRHSVRSVLKYLIVGLALASFASVAQSPQDVRVALVIGNAAYKHAPPLSNSGNDARAMARLLNRLGFKVLEVVDGDRASTIGGPMPDFMAREHPGFKVLLPTPSGMAKPFSVSGTNQPDSL